MDPNETETAKILSNSTSRSVFSTHSFRDLNDTIFSYFSLGFCGTFFLSPCVEALTVDYLRMKSSVDCVFLGRLFILSVSVLFASCGVVTFSFIFQA